MGRKRRGCRFLVLLLPLVVKVDGQRGSGWNEEEAEQLSLLLAVSLARIEDRQAVVAGRRGKKCHYCFSLCPVQVLAQEGRGTRSNGCRNVASFLLAAPGPVRERR